MIEKELIDNLTRAERSFIKCLKYDLEDTEPIANALLLDTEKATTLHITDSLDDAFSELIRASSEAGFETWQWVTSKAPVMPELPAIAEAADERASTEQCSTP